MIYLASPYSHPDPAVKSNRFRTACIATANLLQRGHQVLSPIAHSHPIAVFGKLDGGFLAWRDYDFKLIDMCGIVWVLMLPGWRESRGVKAEVVYALSKGYPVKYLDAGRLEEVPGVSVLDEYSHPDVI